jgi:hypothetical protein
VPASFTTDIDVVDIGPTGEEEDLGRCSILLHGAEPPGSDEALRRGIHTLVKRLSTEPAIEYEDAAPLAQVRVFTILGYTSANNAAKRVY